MDRRKSGPHALQNQNPLTNCYKICLDLTTSAKQTPCENTSMELLD